MILKLLRNVKELAQSWYAVDRIRVAPTTGRLLQLKVGNSILLRNQIYTVQERKLSHDHERGQVVFRLASSEGPAELTVPFNQGTVGEGTLLIDGETTIVFDCDVVIRRSPALI